MHKGKKAKEIKKNKEPLSSKCNKVDDKEKEVNPQLDTNMKLEIKNWSPSLTPSLKQEVDKSPDEIPGGKNYTQDY